MIELVFIIVILGILASIAVPKMAANRHDATIAAIKQDIGTIKQSFAAMAFSQGADNINSFTDVVALNSSLWKPYPLDKTFQNTEIIFSNIGTLDGGKAVHDSHACVRIQLASAKTYSSPVAGYKVGDKYLHIRANTTDELCKRLGINVANEYIKLEGVSVKF